MPDRDINEYKLDSITKMVEGLKVQVNSISTSDSQQGNHLIQVRADIEALSREIVRVEKEVEKTLSIQQGSLDEINATIKKVAWTIVLFVLGAMMTAAFTGNIPTI